MKNPAGELEQLMQRALVGDKRAYQDVLSATAQMIRPYLLRRLSRKEDIEDLVQEVLVSIHKARHTYDATRPYPPWAFAIARFRLQDYLRAHYADRLRHAADISEAEKISAPDVTESGLSYESLRGEISLLSEKQAAILHLIHGEGYTAKEVAEKTGMKETTVKVTAHRAYKILRKRLG